MHGMVTAGEWPESISEYLMHSAASGTSPHTQRLRHYWIKRLAREAYPRGPWQLTAKDLAAFVAQPLWTLETKRSVRGAVRSFYQWGVNAGHVQVDPSRLLPPVRIPPGIPRPAPAHVITRALAAADPRTRVMILLAVLGGLRRAEISCLRTGDLVDVCGESIRVRGKGGRERLVPVHPELAAAIPRDPPGWIFPGKIDGHLSATQVGRLLSRSLGPGWSGHTLRHRFATAAYAHRRDLRTVQLLLGHSKPETTARYTQVPDDALRATVMSINTTA